MSKTKIRPNSSINPMVYCYSTPEIRRHDGWVKIGYTEDQTPLERVRQQTYTADIQFNMEWQDFAMFKDGSFEYFRDTDFHNYLKVEKEIENKKKTEWFHIDGKLSRQYFDDFACRKSIYADAEKNEYELREEQQDAVNMTKEYFENGGTEFLWNAKPRFGKTLTAYDLVRSMGLKKVLIVTNRPSTANSWLEDFNKFIAWRGEHCFVTETDALAYKKGVMSREAFLSPSMMKSGEPMGMIAFESLQGLKGSIYFNGPFDKLKWISELEFDLLIVDESQEGVDTIRTEKAFDNIHRKHTLYMSGTPFKALADGNFSSDQIFNWTYADEQYKKEHWDGEGFNPYERMPRLSMFTYQLSNMIYDKIRRGADLSEDENVDYAFDLNEFFATNQSGNFIHEEEIKKFLHALVTQEKYPFSTPELRSELTHTLWLLNRVNSAKALAKLLKEDPVFSEYKIVLAAGDGRTDDDSDDEARTKSFDKVKKAIAENDKTITLSVGQLTVGVTIPEWTGVLMLCNMQSPSSYMQAAFRTQNPHSFTKDRKRYRKDNAYVFDFDPARTLIIFDEFANNLNKSTAGGQGTADDRKENVRKLLNFFPVLGEDDEGRMVELDAAKVLSIPRRLKCVEVVRRGFMSNFLFQNITNVFGAPGVVKDIVEKLKPASEQPKNRREDKIKDIGNVSVDEYGNVEVPNETIIGKTQDLFGPKVYEEMEEKLMSDMAIVAESSSPEKGVNDFTDSVIKLVKEKNIDPVMDDYDPKKSTRKRIEKQIGEEIERTYDDIKDNYVQREKIAEAERDQRLKVAESKEDIRAANDDFMAAVQEAKNKLDDELEKATKDIVQNTPAKVIERVEKAVGEEEKNSIMKSVRDHLRGFSRTIPSFIMAYGDADLTLANFDDYTEDDVFHEVTGITEADFRFLRDGGEYIDENTGNTEYFEGHLFDETVFNDSIQEFLHKKDELANYFEEGKGEDIFDYIPPQKNNQIYTPRWVVKKMVDELEAENPGCFDDPTNTFADLYMKSGLYITEIVKKLFNSEAIKEVYPDDDERIRHILREQVFGLAPTRLIYLIATNYILGFDETLKSETKNFAEGDAAEAAKNGTLDKLVNKCFSGR